MVFPLKNFPQLIVSVDSHYCYFIHFLLQVVNLFVVVVVVVVIIIIIKYLAMNPDFIDINSARKLCSFIVKTFVYTIFIYFLIIKFFKIKLLLFL
jgi:hypothetical protein